MSTAKKKTPKETAAPQMELGDAPKSGENLQASVQLPQLADAHPLVSQIQQFQITDQDSYVALAKRCQELGSRWDAIESQRTEMKAPALEMGRKIDAFFQPVLKALEEARKLGRNKLEAWDTEQRRIAAQKQREAEEKARKEREEKERLARLERERTQRALTTINDLNLIVANAGQAKTVEQIESFLKMASDIKLSDDLFGAHVADVQKARDSAIASIQQTLVKFKELAEQREKAKTAEDQAAAERAAAIEARKAQMKAEREREKSEAEAKRLREEAEARAQELEQQAATVAAPTVTADLAQVEGMSRAKTYTWKLTDKSKVKPEYLILDTKAIDALVRSAKERAAEIVGGIEVELTYINRLK